MPIDRQRSKFNKGQLKTKLQHIYFLAVMIQQTRVNESHRGRNEKTDRLAIQDLDYIVE